MLSAPKLLLLALVIAGVFVFFRRADNKAKQAEQKRQEEEKQSQKALEMKQDPVCNAFVEETTNHKVKLYDSIYYFCSEDCKNKFIEQHKGS